MAIEWKDRYEQLGVLGDDQLFHLACNESAIHGFRVTAVEILQQRKSPKVNHPELQLLVAQQPLQEDDLQWGVYPLPDVAHESEIQPVVESGPLKASVTTATMFGVQKVDEEVPPADEAPISHNTEEEKE